MSQTPDNQNQYSKKIGSTMTLFAWIIFLGLLTLVFGNYLDKEENPNQQVTSKIHDGITEVVLEQNYAGHYVARAYINEVPVNVLIDTGASDVSVPANVAEQSGLIAGPMMRVTTANGSVPVYSTTISTIELGQISLHNVKASINPHMEDDFVLLGMSFLKDLEITQSQGEMIIKQY